MMTRVADDQRTVCLQVKEFNRASRGAAVTLRQSA
jgi:hypothetical protein